MSYFPQSTQKKMRMKKGEEKETAELEAKGPRIDASKGASELSAQEAASSRLPNWDCECLRGFQRI